MTSAVGGYFGEEALDDVHRDVMPGALRYVSARAAFRALLAAGRPRRVWLPWFACPALPAQARALGIETPRYALGTDGMPPDALPLLDDDWLLVSDHFGVRGAQVTGLLARFPADRLVVDSAQAWHAPPRAVLATLYSPRKFAGLPDGGLLVTGLRVPAPGPGDAEASARRATAAALRASGQREAGLVAFRQAEQELEVVGPADGMSAFTAARLSRIDFDARALRRKANYALLAEALDADNALAWRPAVGDVPLCYPLLSHDGASVRAALAREDVYCPVYWPGLGSAPTDFERRLVADLACLPIDHRYDDADMRRVLRVVAAART